MNFAKPMTTDLAHIALHLGVIHNDTIPAWQGRTLQAAYLKAMAAISPDVSAAIHNGHGYHPYTLSEVLPLVTTELRDLRRGEKLQVVLATL